MRKKRKNVILITVDSLRADFIGIWNKEFKEVTPEIDKFGKDSIVFKNAFSHSSHTRCSFASLFTSKYPSSDTYPILKDNYKTIAEILRDEGFTTIGIHSNPFLSRPFGYTKGFEVLEDSIYPWKSDMLPKKIHLFLSKIFRLVKTRPYLSAKEINEKIFKCIDKISFPFFLWVHYMDVHGPYQSKKGFSYISKIKGEILWRKAVKSPHSLTSKEKNDLIKWYKEEIFYFDKYFGEILNFLKVKELINDTIIVFCSDHGDAFYEHEFYRHERFLYDELLHVPLIIKHPDFPHMEINEIVGLVDVAPTLLGMLKIETKYDSDGESLLPLIRKKGKKKRNFIIADTTLDDKYPHVCIRTDKWKLIINENIKKYELYNVEKDPQEKDNLYEVNKEKVMELRKILRKYYSFEKKESKDFKKEPEIDEEVMRRLKDLGYF